MSDEQLSRRIFGEVGAMLYPVRFGAPSGRLADEPVRALQFLGRPRTSHRAGICEMDRVTVSFQAESLVPPRIDAMRARQIEVSINFFVRDVRLAREHRPPEFDDEGRERNQLDRSCAEIDPRRPNLVIAGNAHDVAGDVVLLANLAEAAREGRISVAAECRDRGGETMPTAECLGELGRIDPAESFSDQFIAGCTRGDPGVYCRRIVLYASSEPRMLTFEFPIGARAPSRVEFEFLPPEEH